MKRIRVFLAVAAMAVGASAKADEAPPRENPYDVIAKIFQPFIGVLLTESNAENRAAEIELEMVDVGGRLPAQMKGAVFKGSVQFPDKVRLDAPVMGETFTVCREGDKVWATPGGKMEFLISKFKVVPKESAVLATPVYLPITAQQAIFLPALFSVARSDVAEMDELRGETCRVITVKLMSGLAENLDAQDFEARLWIAAGHQLRRVEVEREDFSATVDVRKIQFAPSLPATTWNPPEGVADIHRTDLAMLDGLFYILMNSLKSAEGDTPWLTAK
ncbi:MAG: hypothetical protein ACKOAS_00065 [Verrucomicrobiota bacterium]